jgi:hypothetical protein
MFYAASKIKYGKPDPAKMFGVGRMENCNVDQPRLACEPPT